LGSASQSHGFLSNNEHRIRPISCIRPISYNPAEDFPTENFEFSRGFPTNFSTLVYADDEQYAKFHLGQNWQDPLPPLPMMTPAEIQAHIWEEDSIENVLFDLAQLAKQKPRMREAASKPRRMRSERDDPRSIGACRVVMPPSSVRRESQRR